MHCPAVIIVTSEVMVMCPIIFRTPFVLCASFAICEWSLSVKADPRNRLYISQRLLNLTQTIRSFMTPRWWVGVRRAQRAPHPNPPNPHDRKVHKRSSQKQARPPQREPTGKHFTRKRTTKTPIIAPAEHKGWTRLTLLRPTNRCCNRVCFSH